MHPGKEDMGLGGKVEEKDHSWSKESCERDHDKEPFEDLVQGVITSLTDRSGEIGSTD